MPQIIIGSDFNIVVPVWVVHMPGSLSNSDNNVVCDDMPSLSCVDQQHVLQFNGAKCTFYCVSVNFVRTPEFYHVTQYIFAGFPEHYAVFFMLLDLK